MTAGGCNASNPLLLRNNSVRYPHQKAQGLSQAKFIEEAYSKRAPVQNPKLRYFKPFEFLEHTGSPTAQSPTDARCFAFIGVAFRTMEQCRRSKTAHLKIPCTLLESDFLLAAQHSSKKDRRFNCFSGMCLCALELAPFFEVEIQLHTWHQICSLTTCGLLGSDTSIPMALMPTGKSKVK